MKKSLISVTLVAAVGFEEMASKEILEDVINRAVETDERYFEID